MPISADSMVEWVSCSVSVAIGFQGKCALALGRFSNVFKRHFSKRYQPYSFITLLDKALLRARVYLVTSTYTHPFFQSLLLHQYTVSPALHNDRHKSGTAYPYRRGHEREDLS